MIRTDRGGKGKIEEAFRFTREKEGGCGWWCQYGNNGGNA